jgi:hypothetical protein
MNNDIGMLLALARVKRFDRLTADDYKNLETAQHDLLTEQINFQRIDLDAQIANVKLNLAQAKKELKAASPTYSGDIYV